jgi:hypothetical protein
MDTLVNPGDNFDAYVNGTWVKTIKFQMKRLTKTHKDTDNSLVTAINHKHPPSN